MANGRTASRRGILLTVHFLSRSKYDSKEDSNIRDNVNYADSYMPKAKPTTSRLVGRILAFYLSLRRPLPCTRSFLCHTLFTNKSPNIIHYNNIIINIGCCYLAHLNYLHSHRLSLYKRAFKKWVWLFCC